MNASRLWTAQCGDEDCWPCSVWGGRGRVVEAPAEWDEAKVVKTLQVQGWTCEAGGKFEFVDDIDDTDEDAEIHLLA